MASISFESRQRTASSGSLPVDKDEVSFSAVPQRIDEEDVFVFFSLDQDVKQAFDKAYAEEVAANVHEGLSGTVLNNGQYRLGELLRSESHYDVYEVASYRSASCPGIASAQAHLLGQMPHIEARAYTLEGIDKKLAKYRRRSMRRLACRTVWSERVGEKMVAIYKKDLEDKQHKKPPQETPGFHNGSVGQNADQADEDVFLAEHSYDAIPLSGQDSDSVGSLDTTDAAVQYPPTGRASMKAATRETARAKQQRRRARKRESKRQQAGGERINDSGLPQRPRWLPDDPVSEEGLMSLVKIVHAMQILSESAAPVEAPPGKCLQPGLPACLQEDPMEGLEFLTWTDWRYLANAKISEISFLEALECVLPWLLYQKSKEYGCVSFYEVPLKRESTERWKAKMEQALKNCHMVLRVTDFVKDLLARAKVINSKLAEQEARSYQLGQPWDWWPFDKAGLARKRESLQKIARVLFPYTMGYFKVQADIDLITEALNDDDMTLPKAVKFIRLVKAGDPSVSDFSNHT